MKNVIQTMILSLALSSSFSTAALAYGGSSTVGPANPSSVLCVQVGGKIGEVSECVFGDSSRIETWTLWSEKHESTLAVQALFSPREHFHPRPGMVGMPNPAAYNCVAKGGELKTRTSWNGEKQITFCSFSDKSEIEEWTLFRGADDASNAELVRAIHAVKSLGN